MIFYLSLPHYSLHTQLLMVAEFYFTENNHLCYLHTCMHFQLRLRTQHSQRCSSIHCMALRCLSSIFFPVCRYRLHVRSPRTTIANSPLHVRRQTRGIPRPFLPANAPIFSIEDPLHRVRFGVSGSAPWFPLTFFFHSPAGLVNQTFH